MSLQTNIILGDSREVLRNQPNGCYNLIVTSPPYADARKKHYSSISVDEYPNFLLSFHDEFWRVLADDGSLIINIKDKVIDGVRNRYVWKTIMALEDAGWRCVDDYLWLKPNAMPGYWKNRLRDEWEYCFHLTKRKEFKMYQSQVEKPIGDWAAKRLENLTGKSAERHNSENASGFGRDLRAWKDRETVLPGNTVSVPLVGKNMGHPAVYPQGLPEFFIKLFTKEGDWVLDPFAGSGSTGLAAEALGRNVTLIDNKEEYTSIIQSRLEKSGVKRVRTLSNGDCELLYQKIDQQSLSSIFEQNTGS
jgi:DNA modification methylase